MPDDLLERAVAESRIQTAAALRDALRTAPSIVLAKLAVDLVPELFRNDYDGEPARFGATWADAIARPRTAVLPTFLVRIHHGAFVQEEVQTLVAEMMAAHASQAALVVIGPLVSPDVRNVLGAAVPWLVDTDGLIHLMMGANIGVRARYYETKYVDADYFR
ncbi:MAG TPA: hypothetical protein VEK79_10785 [Thermoanaerobaculia bacterium]|nr:hypothetical protein [Thermoanaerobaculia bacterium]